jgi:uncharacterized protein (TIGR03790 family)
MKIVQPLLCAVIVATASSLLNAQSVSYDDVMLIVNDSSHNSVEIGNYFASRRNIPARNIMHIKVDTSETMDSAAFIPLKWRIQSWMKSNGLVDSINYIVTTKGCPLRIRTQQWDVFDGNTLKLLGGQSSFEDCLALINGADSTRILASRGNFFTSRYYKSVQHFRHDQQTMPYYLVTRLDAYTVEQVKGYIRKAESPALVGEGNWVLDLDPGRENPSYGIGNTWLRDAAAGLTTKGMRVTFDTTDTYLHGQSNVIGYASWGSNDGHSGGGEAAKPGNTWMNGSIAETYVSTGGRSFQPGAGYGQSLVADWIAEGASAVKGYTDEPYLTVMAEPDILFDRYTSGFNMAESYWAASPLIAWRQVVIGDPKMRLGVLMTAPADPVAIGSAQRNAEATANVWVRNVSKGAIQITGATVDGTDSADFRATPAGGFPIAVAAGDSVAIPVTFTARTYRDESATVRFRHRRGPSDSLAFSIGVPVTGTGLRPVMTAPDTVDFGGGSGEITRAITLANTTLTDTISVTRLAISGAGAAYYTLKQVSYPHMIPGGTSWDVMVTYTPPVAGSTPLATLAVTSSAGKTVNIRLRATAGSSGIEGDTIALGGGDLSGVTPNPFTSTTTIRYRSTGEREHITIDVLNLLGQRMAVVSERIESAGEHSATFDGAALPTGSYLCRMVIEGPSGSRTITRPILLVR